MIKQVKCYGSKAALTMDATTKEKNGLIIQTVNIEVAPMINRNQGADWSRKIIFQLGVEELPILCAVLLGYAAYIDMRRDIKSIRIERQQRNLFVSGRTQGEQSPFALPITAGDSFRLAALCMQQLKMQAGNLDSDLILASLRGAAALAAS